MWLWRRRRGSCSSLALLGGVSGYKCYGGRLTHGGRCEGGSCGGLRERYRVDKVEGVSDVVLRMMICLRAQGKVVSRSHDDVAFQTQRSATVALISHAENTQDSENVAMKLYDPLTVKSMQNSLLRCLSYMLSVKPLFRQ